MFCVLFSCDLEAQATEKIHLPDERKEPSLENQALHVDLTHVDKKNPPLKGRINSLHEVSEIGLKGGIQLVRLNALDSLWP